MRFRVAASSEADLGKTNNKWMCRKCKTLWMHGYFQVDEVASTNRYDKLIEKYQNKPSRTRKQQSYLDYLLGRKHVIAVGIFFFFSESHLIRNQYFNRYRNTHASFAPIKHALSPINATLNPFRNLLPWTRNIQVPPSLSSTVRGKSANEIQQQALASLWRPKATTKMYPPRKQLSRLRLARRNPVSWMPWPICWRKSPKGCHRLNRWRSRIGWNCYSSSVTVILFLFGKTSIMSHMYFSLRKISG